MSKAQIIAELPKLSPADRAEIQARLEDLAGEGWLEAGELSPAEKALLEGRLADYERNPDAGSSWQEVEARILANLRK
jgi:putative addiction module component (TIGR02574 family)